MEGRPKCSMNECVGETNWRTGHLVKVAGLNKVLLLFVFL